MNSRPTRIWITTFIAIVCAILVMLGYIFRSDNDAVDSENSAVSETILELPEAETAWLWELEHRSNVLVTYGFSTLQAALKSNDVDQLLTIFADDFSGQFLSDPRIVTFEGSEISAIRSESTGIFNSMTASEFATELLGLRANIDSMSGISLGVKRIGPLNRDTPSGRWTVACEMWMRGSQGDHRVEVTTLLQMEIKRPEKGSLQNGGWIHGITIEETAVSDSSQIMFEDVTKSSGADTSKLHDNWTTPRKSNNPGGVYACDFNRDGMTDFLVTDVNPQANGLYQAIGDGKFKDVTSTLGLRRLKQVSLARGNAAFVDLNNDGWVDLVHTEGAVWENQGGKKFVDRSAATNLFRLADHQNVELKSISIADFDRDGLLDLYVLRRNEMPTSWLQDKGTGPGSVLCRNLGGWQFEDVTTSSGTDGHNSLIFTTVWLDADNDNWPDLAVINEFGDSFLYVNQQDGSFAQQDLNPDQSDFGSMGVDVGDVDNDGLIDLYVAGMYSKAGSRVIGNLKKGAYSDDVMSRLRSLIDGSELYRNRGGLDFEASGQKDRVHNIGWSWGPTLADFNNDGALDIYAPSGYMSRDRNKPDG